MALSQPRQTDRVDDVAVEENPIIPEEERDQLRAEREYLKLNPASKSFLMLKLVCATASRWLCHLALTHAEALVCKSMD